MQVDCDHGFHWSNTQLIILAGILSFDILYLQGEKPLLIRNMLVNFGDILAETSKSSAFWDKSLKWLLLFRPDGAR